MKANQEIKSRIKAYMRNNDCSVTALDLPAKFVRGMSLTKAIEFMDRLEREDACIVKAPVEGNGSEAIHTYYYKFKKKNRGKTIVKVNLKDKTKPVESADVMWDIFNTDYFDPRKFLVKEDAKKVQQAINLVASYRRVLEENDMII